MPCPPPIAATMYRVAPIANSAVTRCANPATTPPATTLVLSASDSPASPVRGSGGDDSARHDSPPGSVRQELHREPSHASTDPQHTPIQYFASQSIPEKIPSATEQTTQHGSPVTGHGPRPTDHAAFRYTEIQLREIATETSEAERRAAGAERELMDWKTAQFMEQHLGEEYQGLIISVQKFGVFVELAEVFVEGLLPLAALEEAAGSRCIYREFDHSIVALPGGSTMTYADRPAYRDKFRPNDKSSKGHKGERGDVANQADSPTSRKGRGAKPQAQRAWHLGDPVQVRAERIDPIRKRVEFALVEPE